MWLCWQLMLECMQINMVAVLMRTHRENYFGRKCKQTSAALSTHIHHPQPLNFPWIFLRLLSSLSSGRKCNRKALKPVRKQHHNLDCGAAYQRFKASLSTAILPSPVANHLCTLAFCPMKPPPLFGLLAFEVSPMKCLQLSSPAGCYLWKDINRP